MKTCTQVQELMANYLDQSCSKEDTNELLAHFASCEGCRTQAQELTTLLAYLYDQTEVDPPADLHEKIMAALPIEPPKKKLLSFRRFVPYGAVAAVFVVFLALGGPRYLQQPLLGVSQDSTAKMAAPSAAAAPAPRAVSPQAPPVPAAEAAGDAAAKASPQIPSMKIQPVLPPAAEDRQISSQMANPSAPQANPPASIMAAPAAPSVTKQSGFTAHLYTKGILSAAEIANRLGGSIQEGTTQIDIAKELLPLLSQLCQEYGLTMDIQTIDDALPFGVLEIIG